MTTRTIIHTTQAPQAIGPYSQAVKVDNTVYLSGQLGLDPATGNLVDGFEAQAQRLFENLRAVCQAAGGDLKDLVKINVFLVDLAQFGIFNMIMERFFDAPYPARSTIQVAALPKGGLVEVEGVMVLAN